MLNGPLSPRPTVIHRWISADFRRCWYYSPRGHLLSFMRRLVTAASRLRQPGARRHTRQWDTHPSAPSSPRRVSPLGPRRLARRCQVPCAHMMHMSACASTRAAHPLPPLILPVRTCGVPALDAAAWAHRVLSDLLRPSQSFFCFFAVDLGLGVVALRLASSAANSSPSLPICVCSPTCSTIE